MTVCNLLIPANPAVDNLDEHLDVHLEIAIEVHEQAPTRQSPDCLATTRQSPDCLATTRQSPDCLATTRQSPDCSRPAWTQAEQAADNREGR